MNRRGVISLTLALGISTLLNAGNNLSKAALRGDVEKIKACLATGERIDEIDKWGWTPLMWAVYYNYAPAAQCLLDHKADPNARITKAYGHIPPGSTPLTACAYYGLDDMARMLLKAGADRNLVNSEGKKPIDYAREREQQGMIAILEPPKAQPTPKPQPQQPAVPPPAPKPQPTPAQPAAKPAPATQPTTPAPQEQAAPAKKTTKKSETPKKKSEPPAIK